MEHFKRLAFCMLYLFTFIWQLSAQVKKIPQWERFEIVLQGTAKGTLGQCKNLRGNICKNPIFA